MNTKEILQGIKDWAAPKVIYDISAAHNNTKYTDLSNALGTNGGNIPQEYRKGGITVRYVQSSDNKYVQARLMSDTFNTTETNWQGVDNEPTVGSDNLVKSGGVYDVTGGELVSIATPEYKCINPQGVTESDGGLSYTCDRFYKCIPFSWIYYKLSGHWASTSSIIAFYETENESSFISRVAILRNDTFREDYIQVPANAHYFKFSSLVNDWANSFVKTNIQGINSTLSKITKDIEEEKFDIGYNALNTVDYTYKCINPSTGELDDDGGLTLATDGFLPCKGTDILFIRLSTTYANRVVLAFYDSSKEYLPNDSILTSYNGEIIERLVTIPSGAAYYRAATKTGTWDTSLVVNGSKAIIELINSNNKGNVEQLNTYYGYNSMKKRVGDADYNTAIGAYTLQKVDNTGGGDNGKYNTAIGYNALGDNTTGNHNTAVGYGAAAGVTTAEGVVALGEDAMNLCGGDADFNVAVGRYSLMKVQGRNNIALGTNSGYEMNNGSSNILIGGNTGYSGLNEPTNIKDDGACIFIGENSGKSVSTTIENAIAIGYNAKVSESNSIQLGNNYIVKVKTKGDYECQTDGGGIILRSPNGTLFKITVTDQGQISVTQVN